MYFNALLGGLKWTFMLQMRTTRWHINAVWGSCDPLQALGVWVNYPLKCLFALKEVHVPQKNSLGAAGRDEASLGGWRRGGSSAPQAHPGSDQPGSAPAGNTEWFRWSVSAPTKRAGRRARIVCMLPVLP